MLTFFRISGPTRIFQMTIVFNISFFPDVHDKIIFPWTSWFFWIPQSPSWSSWSQRRNTLYHMVVPEMGGIKQRVTRMKTSTLVKDLIGSLYNKPQCLGPCLSAHTNIHIVSQHVCMHVKDMCKHVRFVQAGLMLFSVACHLM